MERPPQNLVGFRFVLDALLGIVFPLCPLRSILVVFFITGFGPTYTTRLSAFEWEVPPGSRRIRRVAGIDITLNGTFIVNSGCALVNLL